MYCHKILLVLALCSVMLPAAVGEVQEAMPGTEETGDDCSTCHSSTTPSADDLIPNRRCMRSGDLTLVPTPEEEAASPDVVLLDQLSDLYVPVVFPHKLHASMESMADGCGMCHHHTENDEIKSCRTCHGGTSNPANLRQPGLKGAYHRQCLACHREWSNDTNCVVCHAKRELGVPVMVDADPTDILGRLHPNVSVPEKWVYPTPELEEGLRVTFYHKEHVDLFGKRCVECHAKENCSRCHDTSEPHPKHVRQDPHEDCAKCHDVEGDCTQCHREDEAPPFDHFRRSNFMIKPYHKDIGCMQCHATESAFTGQKPECASCHAADWMPADFDHSKTGLTLSEGHLDIDCLGCHTEGLGKPTGCGICHDDNRNFPDSIPGTITDPSQLNPLTATQAPGQP